MYRFIEGLPPDVLGIEADGKITHEDYRDRLIPKVEAMRADGPIKAVMVMRSDMSDYSLEALWDDQIFGFSHWRDFSRLALVTDHRWMKTAVAIFRPFYPAEIRTFSLAELDAAKAWIVGAKETQPA
ncbi:MAG: STAS/SEC14 domain-containing protein [Caulobacteraceae bacterium]|nr:STAS/SEC14 domain-containing protein [Caulobacteraceae bacterium]